MSHVHDGPPIFASFFNDDRVVGRHVVGHHRVRPDGGAAADAHRADDLGAGPDRDVVLDDGLRPAG